MNTKDYTVMTLAELRAELNDRVDEYNSSKDVAEKAALALKHKEIVDQYNKLSLLTAYGVCLKAEQPILALVQAYYYDTIKVSDKPQEKEIDGVTKSVLTRSIADGNKKFNLVNFIEWAADFNKTITVDKNWRIPMNNARKTVEQQWEKFFASGKDSHSMSISKTKTALQEMFDALVFIPSETGKNAVIANGNIAKWVLGFSNVRKDSKAEDGKINIKGTVMSKQTWATLQMDILHMAVEGKTFDIVYGYEEEVAEPEVEAEADAE